MQLQHLTDEEIQDYLDGNLSEDNALLARQHLETCPLCRKAVKQYQSIYVRLEDDQGFELSKGFARSVVNKLPAEAEAKSYSGIINIILAVMGIVVSLGITLRYVDLKPLGRALSDFIPGPDLGTGLLDLLEGLLVGLNGNVGFLIVALLVFFLVAGLDRFVLQPRYKRI